MKLTLLHYFDSPFRYSARNIPWSLFSGKDRLDDRWTEGRREGELFHFVSCLTNKEGEGVGEG